MDRGDPERLARSGPDHLKMPKVCILAWDDAELPQDAREPDGREYGGHPTSRGLPLLSSWTQGREMERPRMFKSSLPGEPLPEDFMGSHTVHQLD